MVPVVWTFLESGTPARTSRTLTVNKEFSLGTIVDRFDAPGTTVTWLFAMSAYDHHGYADPVPPWPSLKEALPEYLRHTVEEQALAPRTGDRFRVRRIEARGWPWRAAWYVSDEPSDPDAALMDEGAIVLDRWQSQRIGTKRTGGLALPMRPLWPGFLANTALYAAPWSVLLLVPVVRSAIRRVRGRCSRCGYDGRGLDKDAPCPECGSPQGHR